MIRILFDGPPSHESGRFIEVENEKGESINFGDWVQDGEFWVLQFPDNREINSKLEMLGIRTISFLNALPGQNADKQYFNDWFRGAMKFREEWKQAIAKE